MTEADMPSFTIKASDELACVIIRMWILLAKSRHVNEDKVQSAENVLAAARYWQQTHGRKRPD